MIKAWLRKTEENSKGAALVQFVKFGLVGVSNTAISYGIEMLCYYVFFPTTAFTVIRSFLSNCNLQVGAETIRIILTTVLAFLISVTNSFYWNSKHVFAEKRTGRELFFSYIKTVLCYGVTGLVLSPWLKVFLTEMGMAYWLATLFSLVISIPLNFVLNKFWAYRKQSRHE